LYYAEKCKLGDPSWRDKLYRFLASPASSPGAQLFSFFILVISIGSVFTFGWESTQEATWIRKQLAKIEDPSGQTSPLDPNRYNDPDELAERNGWRAWNLFLLAVFVPEFLLRCICYEHPLLDGSIWVDFLCIVPLFVKLGVSFKGTSPLELYLPGEQSTHWGMLVYLCSAFTALRLLKMTRYFLGTQILHKTLHLSLTACAIPSYLLLMLLTFFGTILFAVEYDPLDDGSTGRVQDVTSSWWMLVVTMTTVGYGDLAPQTGPGRVIMYFCLIAGLVVLAMPLAIVGGYFQAEWDARALVLISDQVKRALISRGLAVTDYVHMYLEFDQDRNGEISYKEYKVKQEQKQKRSHFNTYSDSSFGKKKDTFHPEPLQDALV
jgi:hypothetical protein